MPFVPSQLSAQDNIEGFVRRRVPISCPPGERERNAVEGSVTVEELLKYGVKGITVNGRDLIKIVSFLPTSRPLEAFPLLLDVACQMILSITPREAAGLSSCM